MKKRFSEAKRLKQLEEENCRLKGLVSELMIDNHILKNVLSKKERFNGY
jgi:hypothetical protein